MQNLLPVHELQVRARLRENGMKSRRWFLTEEMIEQRYDALIEGWGDNDYGISIRVNPIEGQPEGTRQSCNGPFYWPPMSVKVEL